mmetsp:Transcript_19812/g.48480  ORF Transcript_19812/g.48480 Transcript_19812/m.48480 type:complete len:972 (+) Transcript_19812:304-3219(+)
MSHMPNDILRRTTSRRTSDGLRQENIPSMYISSQHQRFISAGLDRQFPMSFRSEENSELHAHVSRPLIQLQHSRRSNTSSPPTRTHGSQKPPIPFPGSMKGDPRQPNVGSFISHPGQAYYEYMQPTTSGMYPGLSSAHQVAPKGRPRQRSFPLMSRKKHEVLFRRADNKHYGYSKLDQSFGEHLPFTNFRQQAELAEHKMLPTALYTNSNLKRSEIPKGEIPGIHRPLVQKRTVHDYFLSLANVKKEKSTRREITAPSTKHGAFQFSLIDLSEALPNCVNGNGLQPSSKMLRSAIPSFAEIPSLVGRERSLGSTPGKSPMFKMDARADQYILERMKSERMRSIEERILRSINPSKESERKHLKAVRCMHELIRRHSRGQGHRSRNGNVQVYPHGSYASKTYLPDSAVDVTAYFVTKFDKKRGEYKKNFWAQQVAHALAQNDNIHGDARLTDVAVSQDPIFGTQILHCAVDEVPIRVSLNRVDVLESLALLETVDVMVGHDHLVKRTILLVKTWARNEARILKNGMLNGYAIQRIVLTVFNCFHSHIRTPMQGFYCTLAYLNSFDWEWHALDVGGAIQRSSLPDRILLADNSGCSIPRSTHSLLSASVIAKYTTAAHKIGNYVRLENGAINIIESTEGKAYNNLTSHIGREGAERIKGEIAKAVSIMNRAVREEGGIQAIKTNNSMEDVFSATLRTYSGRPAIDFVVVNEERRSSSHPNRMSYEGLAGETAVRADTPPRDSHPGIGQRVQATAESRVWKDQKQYDGCLFELDPFATSMEIIQQSLAHAKQFQSPVDITEMQLVAIIAVILDRHGKLPIGALGRLIRTAINSFSLPQVIQDCGGIKAFLMRHNYVFILGENHPNNPLVHLDKRGINNTNGEVSADPLIMSMVNKVISQTGGVVPKPNSSSNSHKKKTGGMPMASQHHHFHAAGPHRARWAFGRRRTMPLSSRGSRPLGRPSGGKTKHISPPHF